MEWLNTADTLWTVLAAVLVFIMIPGVAFFYGGLTKTSSVLNMIMLSVASMAVVAVVWITVGFGLTFIIPGQSFGITNWSSLTTVAAVNGAELTIPIMSFMLFQMMFAAITPALMTGGVPERLKFSSWLVFVGLWTLLVYVPIAHAVFSFGDANGEGAGILARWGVLDYAGGTAVHINAAAATLGLVAVVGARKMFVKESPAVTRPHSMPLVFLGVTLLWFGWFGFNAGSALAVNTTMVVAAVNTMVAAATGAIGWVAVEWWKDKHPTLLGAGSGIVAGLVAITPACAFVDVYAAMIIGFVAGAVCVAGLRWKYKVGVDDSFDVAGIHGVAGVLGSILIGVFATTAVNEAGTDGLLHGGGFTLLGKQTVAVLAVGVFSFTVTFLLAWIINKTLGLRVPENVELEGIDALLHAETAYEHSPSPVSKTKSMLGYRTETLEDEPGEGIALPGEDTVKEPTTV